MWSGYRPIKELLTALVLIQPNMKMSDADDEIDVVSKKPAWRTEQMKGCGKVTT
jgi:hypothetical protein